MSPVPDPRLATAFYISGLGLTRDPYLMTGPRNMWVNVGRSQFHLPTSKPQVLRGHTGLVIPDRGSLLKRLGKARKNLDGTRFDFHEDETFVEATCPWGNRIRCHEPSARFGPISLGMPYVEFDVPPQTADGHRALLHRHHGHAGGARRGCVGALHAGLRSASGSICCSARPTARFPTMTAITSRSMSPTSPAHIAGCWSAGLIFEESSRHQYRFKDIVDPQTGKLLFTIEHEVRSMTSPMFLRPLVNRDPNQNIMSYDPGHDAWIPGRATTI